MVADETIESGIPGLPVGTVAFYGPDDHRATKVAVGIVTREGEEPAELERWFSDESDVRDDEGVNRAIVEFIEHHGVKTVVLADGVIGCPHEEGVDYPSGAKCPECPFWATRDRWSGDMLHESRRRAGSRPGLDPLTRLAADAGR